MKSALAWATLVLAATACGTADREASSPATTSTTAPAAAPSAGRQLTETERAAMLAALGAEQGTSRKAWFAVAPGDAEAMALKNSFESVFKQAGWDTETQTVTGMVLKPGLSILIAAEEPPSYVAVAQQALESTGFEWKTGTGYGPYYEERKRADPKWPGIPLVAGQDFVVVIGPKPPAS